MSNDYEEYESAADVYDPCEGQACTVPKTNAKAPRVKVGKENKPEVAVSADPNFSSYVSSSSDKGFSFSAGPGGFVLKFDSLTGGTQMDDLKASGQPLPGGELTFKIPVHSHEGIDRHDFGRSSVEYVRNHDVVTSDKKYYPQPFGKGVSSKSSGDFWAEGLANSDLQTQLDNISQKEKLRTFTTGGGTYDVYRDGKGTDRGNMYVLYKPNDSGKSDGYFVSVKSEGNEWQDPEKIFFRSGLLSGDGKSVITANAAGITPKQVDLNVAAPAVKVARPGS